LTECRRASSTPRSRNQHAIPSPAQPRAVLSGNLGLRHPNALLPQTQQDCASRNEPRISSDRSTRRSMHRHLREGARGDCLRPEEASHLEECSRREAACSWVQQDCHSRGSSRYSRRCSFLHSYRRRRSSDRHPSCRRTLRRARCSSPQRGQPSQPGACAASLFASWPS
jgi:hypothetical protein